MVGKKSVIIILVVLILISGISIYLIFQKPVSQSKCGDGICGPLEKVNPNLCPKDCKENIPTQNNELGAFIAIHMEAGGGGQLYSQTMWPVLIDLIEAADQHGHKLTLEFNPQWATYILADSSRLDLLRSWEVNGHEIALHHHGPAHADWNGYTDEPGHENEPKYRGTIRDMMDLINQLPASGTVVTGGCTNEDTDWPEGVIYDTDGGLLKDHLLSTPKAMTWNDFPITQLRYRQYATNDPQAATLDKIESAYSTASKDEIIGIVFHVHDYNKRSIEIDQLFASLEENNINVLGVKDILQ